MATLITHLRSIPRNFVDAPKGQGFKAIGSALKTIFSPKKTKVPQQPNPSFSATKSEPFDIENYTVALQDNHTYKALQNYELRYGKRRSTRQVVEEFFAIREILDLAKKNDPSLFTKLFDLENALSPDLNAKLLKARSSASQDQIHKFVSELQPRMDHKENAQFATYSAQHGNGRAEKKILKEFDIILQIIEFFKDDSNMWTDISFGALRDKLPPSVHAALRKHQRKITDETEKYSNKAHLKFFRDLIGQGIKFNLNWNETRIIPNVNRGRKINRQSPTPIAPAPEPTLEPKNYSHCKKQTGWFQHN
ncbi:MAG: hypothetical protein P0S96_06140 [Simkaniaceae bacterium]|nr:hypothetical protein [Candidatus Sacchlamyda saccharinae]